MPVNAKCVPLPRKPHCQPFQASVKASHQPFSASYKIRHAKHITPTFIYLHPEVPALKHIHMCEQCHQHNRRQHQIARTAAQMKRHAKQRQRINRKTAIFNRMIIFQALYFFGSIESDIKIRKCLPEQIQLSLPVPDTPLKRTVYPSVFSSPRTVSRFPLKTAEAAEISPDVLPAYQRLKPVLRNY